MSIFDRIMITLVFLDAICIFSLIVLALMDVKDLIVRIAVIICVLLTLAIIIGDFMFIWTY